MNVLIVDDQKLLRESMRFILETDPSIQVVGSVGNGIEALDFLALHPVDVVLMDITMPLMDGLTATQKAKRLYPKVKCVILTTFETDETLLKSYVAGADGFLLKDLAPELLIASLKLTYGGIHVLHDSAYRYIQEHIEKRQDYLEQLGRDAQESLNDCDYAILKLIASGYANKEIADQLSFSEGTIKNKVSRLLQLLQAKDRSHLIIIAIKNKLI